MVSTGPRLLVVGGETEKPPESRCDSGTLFHPAYESKMQKISKLAVDA